MSVGHRLRALTRLMRLRTTIGAPILTLVGWSVVGRPSDLVRLACGAIAAFATIGFAQVINDIIDAELDAIAKPDRLIPSGKVTVSAARTVAGVLAAVAALTGAVASVPTTLLAVLGLLLGALYSLRLKSTILVGNVVVALVSSSTLWFGVWRFEEALAQLAVAQTIVFLFIFGNELFKTAVDVDGDAAGHQRTIATELGIPATVMAIYLCAVALVSVIIIAWLLDLAGPLFLVVALVLLGVPATISALSLGRGGSANIYSGHRLWKLSWVPGMLVLLLLR